MKDYNSMSAMVADSKIENFENNRQEQVEPNKPSMAGYVQSAAENDQPISVTTKKDGLDDKDGVSEKTVDKQMPPEKGNDKKSQVELLVEFAMESIGLFHTPDNEAFASIMIDGHTENLKVQSHVFYQWLGRLYYQNTKKPAGVKAIKDAQNHLASEGLYGGKEIPIHLRYAWYDDSIYVDLCDSDWRQVEVTRDGWKVIESTASPVKFIRVPGMVPLPIPEKDGSVEILWNFLNIENENSLVMILAWLIGAMKPTGPYPVLVLQGEQGTAKSTTARLLRELVDPSTVPSQSLPRTEQNLVIAANNSWVLNFDNLSYLSNPMSDALCRLSTGGGFRTRTLHTNDSEMLFHITRPMIMNGITDIATRHDLVDRSIIIQLPTIPEDRRKPEKVLLNGWNLKKGKILGALYDALATALSNVDSVKLSNSPRMADFAYWATAAEGGFGWKPDTFIREYENNRRSLVENALEADSVAVAVIRWVKNNKDHEWHGTATDLLSTFNAMNHDLKEDKFWPRKPNVLSNRLMRAAPSLRKIGIDVQKTKSGDRMIHIVTTKDFNFQNNLDCVRSNMSNTVPDSTEIYQNLTDNNYHDEEMT